MKREASGVAKQTFLGDTMRLLAMQSSTEVTTYKGTAEFLSVALSVK